MGLQTAYIAMTLVPRIDQLAFADASLYEILGTHYALYPAAARETHQAVPLPEDLAPYLRAVLSFLGITDVDVVRVEGVAMSVIGPEKALAAANTESKHLVASLA